MGSQAIGPTPAIPARATLGPGPLAQCVTDNGYRLKAVLLWLCRFRQADDGEKMASSSSGPGLPTAVRGHPRASRFQARTGTRPGVPGAIRRPSTASPMLTCNTFSNGLQGRSTGVWRDVVRRPGLCESLVIKGFRQISEFSASDLEGTWFRVLPLSPKGFVGRGLLTFDNRVFSMQPRKGQGYGGPVPRGG